jgi:hypothetical protein
MDLSPAERAAVEQLIGRVLTLARKAAHDG